MALLAPIPELCPPAFVFAADRDGQRGSAFDAWNSSGYRDVDEMKIGETVYRPRNRATAHCYPVSRGNFECLVLETPGIVGSGDDQDAAYADWRNRVHAAFQRLIAMRPFEFTEPDRRQWRVLESFIDVDHYRRSAPIRVRQFGAVEYGGYQFPRSIKWVDGPRDYVTLERAPAEFAGIKPGQWIEAICDHSPLDGRLIRVVHVASVASIRRMTAEQQQEFFASLPSADELPDSDLDWTKLD